MTAEPYSCKTCKRVTVHIVCRDEKVALCDECGRDKVSEG